MGNQSCVVSSPAMGMFNSPVAMHSISFFFGTVKKDIKLTNALLAAIRR